MKLSPDKKAVEKKNTNYFIGTNVKTIERYDSNGQSNQNSLLRFQAMRKNTAGTTEYLNENEAKFPAHSTKISSQIEKDNKFKLGDSQINKAIGLSFKNLLSLTRSKIHEKKILDEFNKDKSKDEEEEVEEDDNKKDTTNDKEKNSKSESENEEDIQNKEINEIQIVKKGMKIRVKHDDKINEIMKTHFEDILRKKEQNESEAAKEEKRLKEEEEDKPKKRTNIQPYNLHRVMLLNEYLLEGKTEEEEAEEISKEAKDKEAERKAEEMRNFEPGNKSIDEEDEKEEKENLYLEKFKYLYRSNVITTGTVSIVVSSKHVENLIDLPNPCAVSYGNIIIDDGEESSIEDTKSNTKQEVKGLRRNDTILPGSLMRQNTNLSKGITRRTKTNKRVFASKVNGKKNARLEEEHNEENVMKKLIMDIPEDSPFYQIIDMESFKKELEEDELLDQDEDEEAGDEFVETEEDEEDFTGF
jgi:hypothetical protein